MLLNLKKIAVAAVAVISLGATSAFASLVGDTVNLTYYYPDSSSVYANYGNQTVPTASYDMSDTGAIGLTLQVTGTQIIIDYANQTSWSSASFNGWVLTDLTQSNITGVTIDSQNNFGLTASDISWTSNSVTVNWQGLPFDGNSSVTLNVSTGSVPEPTSLALLGLGLVGLVSVRRKAKQF